MTLSKKRQKELNRLKAEAQALLAHQQDVIAHANAVAHQASEQAQHLTREQVYPRVQAGYQSYIVPAANRAGELVNHTIVPAVGTALGTALSVVDVANDTRVKSAVKRLKGATARFSASAPAPKKRTGVGTYIAIGVGVAALAGVAYAVWQTFRADDELWVADEPETPAS